MPDIGKPQTTLYSAARWIVSALITAAIGGIVALYLDRGEPDVSGIGISYSEKYNDRFVQDSQPITTPSDLRELLEKSEWTNFAPLRESAITYKDLQDVLTDNEQRMKRFISNATRLQSDLPEINSLLQRGSAATPADVDRLFDLWEINDGFIYGAIRGEYHFDALDVDIHKQYKGTPRLYLVPLETQDGTTIYGVSRKYGRFNSVLLPETPSDVDLNKFSAMALAYWDTPVLESFISVAQRDSGNTDLPNSILRMISEIRTGQSRWVLSTLLSNRGGRAIAVAPTATLTINTEEMRSGDARVGRPTVIVLEHRSSDGDLAPISLKEGDASLTDWVSNEPLGSSEFASSLLAAFRTGTLTARVVFKTYGGGPFARHAITLEKVTFAPVDGQ